MIKKTNNKKSGYTRIVDFDDTIKSRTKSASSKFTTGYTIIETMIAIGLFLIIAVYGMGALLNANLVHNKSEDQRAIMDNLSFIMEDMSRNIRTGYNYRCYFGPSDNWDGGEAGDSVLTVPRSCDSGGAFAFEEAHTLLPSDDGSDQWVYKIESSGGGIFNIYKSTEGGAVNSFVQMNLQEIIIKGSSGFEVLGAEPPADGDFQQPLVKIHLIGEIHYKNLITPFSLQTTVSQRLIDVKNTP